MTPLHLAASEGHLKVADVLLSNGADVSLKDQEGRNTLDLAIDHGHELVPLYILYHYSV